MSKQDIRVVGERRCEPELRKLARALIAIAVRQAEAAGESGTESGDGENAVMKKHTSAEDKAAS
jgi:hypothetical protein